MYSYEIKHEQDLDTLAKFTDQHPEMKEFVDLLMKFSNCKEDDEKPDGRIQIAFGKKRKEKLDIYLLSALTKPRVCLDSWREEPRFHIMNNDKHLLESGCMINLNSITGFTEDNKDYDNMINRIYEFKYNNAGDYQFIIQINR